MFKYFFNCEMKIAMCSGLEIAGVAVNWKMVRYFVVRIFSDVLVVFTTYRQSNLAIENAEVPQPVLAGHFQRKILSIIQQIATLNFRIIKRNLSNKTE